MIGFSTVAMVGLGGMVGSITRFLILQASWALFGTHFPAGTMLVNVLGSFLIGISVGWADHVHAFSPETRALILPGFLGGLTTFAAFALDSVNLLQRGEYLYVLIYITASMLLSLIAVLAGMTLMNGNPIT